MSENSPLPDEADIEICCEILEEVLTEGWLMVTEAEPGLLVEVLKDPNGPKGIAINFCPFCGTRRPSAALMEE